VNNLNESFRLHLELHPEDGDKRYEYAHWLELQGQVWEALVQYQHAARSGNPAALIKLKGMSLQPEWTPPKAPPAPEPPERKRRTKRSLLLLVLLLSLLAAGRLWDLPPLTGAVATGERSLPTREEELPKLVVQNGFERYLEDKGVKAPDLGALLQPPPNNRLSRTVPPLPKDCPCELRDPYLALHYYPETNQLALARGEEVLALYKVASGPQLPFAKSRVTRRVANPNGGRGAYGTRGLELQDNYAIHGTNRPELIGQPNITKGCLRLSNEDIEELYPYVATGTPFEVRTGKPPQPTFAEGLPALGGPSNPADEETPSIVYSWKN